MNEIKRYDHIWDKSGEVREVERPQGEWVRWDDVQKYVIEATEELRKLNEEVTQALLAAAYTSGVEAKPDTLVLTYTPHEIKIKMEE
jgi:hypothetical protein